MKIQVSFCFILLITFLLIEEEATAQHVVSGFVYDEQTGEALINAHVYNQRSKKGTLTNPYGFFSFPTIGTDTLKLSFSYVGYREATLSIACKKDTFVRVVLRPGKVLDNVMVKAPKKLDENFAPAGKVSFSGKQLEMVPGLLGEKDIIKSLQLMPGINMGNEGSSGIFVRGGDRGQNLFLLDGMPVYNINHLFGFFSVFTPEIVKSVDVYKGGFPARYSGRLSSVIDIRLKEGNLHKKKLDVTVGTISSKLIYESPIKKGKSSFIVALRRTYADLLYTPLNAIEQENFYKTTRTWSGYNFYDINVKSNFTISGRDRVYFSIYSGRDKLFLSEKEVYMQGAFSNIKDEGRVENRSKYGNQWGNLTLSGRWNHLYNEKLFSNTTILYSTYNYVTRFDNQYLQENETDTLNEYISYQNLSRIRDIGIATDFDFYAFPWLKMLWGLKIDQQSFIPGKLDLNYELKSNPDESFSQNLHNTTENLLEGTVYLENYASIAGKFFVNAGLALMGIKQKTNYFLSLQPRMLANYKLNSKLSLTGSWTRMEQPVHLLVDNGSTFPVDMWVPAVKELKPARAAQIELGIKYNLNNQYELKAEVYRKQMDHVVNYKNGESFLTLDELWSDKITQGKGTATGFEVLLSKAEGKLTGWLAYTFSKTTRQFDNLNNGKPFAFKYDSPHQLKFTGLYKASPKVDIVSSWQYASGMPVTLSLTAYNGDWAYSRSPLDGLTGELGFFDQGIYYPQGVLYYNGINEERLPAYHRLDIGINFKKQKRKGMRTWSFSIYNMYARNNPMMIYMQKDGDGRGVYKNFSVFTFVPSVSYRFSFNTF